MLAVWGRSRVVGTSIFCTPVQPWTTTRVHWDHEPIHSDFLGVRDVTFEFSGCVTDPPVDSPPGGGVAPPKPCPMVDFSPMASCPRLVEFDRPRVTFIRLAFRQSTKPSPRSISSPRKFGTYNLRITRTEQNSSELSPNPEAGVAWVGGEALQRTPSTPSTVSKKPHGENEVDLVDDEMRGEERRGERRGQVRRSGGAFGCVVLCSAKYPHPRQYPP